MAKYAIDGQDTNTATTTILGVDAGATPRRIKVYYVECGSDATPADNAAEYNLQRYTVDGTSTGVTPQALDPGDAAALSEAGEAHSIEPTYTAGAIMLAWMQNQRATFQWFAPPGGEIVGPATADNGVGVQSITVAGSAVNTGVCLHFEEQ